MVAPVKHKSPVIYITRLFIWVKKAYWASIVIDSPDHRYVRSALSSASLERGRELSQLPLSATGEERDGKRSDARV